MSYGAEVAVEPLATAQVRRLCGGTSFFEELETLLVVDLRRFLQWRGLRQLNCLAFRQARFARQARPARQGFPLAPLRPPPL